MSAIPSTQNCSLRITYSTVGTVLVLVESPHAQATDVAGRMVAWRDGMVGNWVGTNEANVCIVVGVGGLSLGGMPRL